MFDDDDGDLGLGIAEAGAAYALLRHGQDRQAETIVREMREQEARAEARAESAEIFGTGPHIEVHVHTGEDEPGIAPVNFLDFAKTNMPQDWDDYIGQEPLKRQVAVHIASAKHRKAPLPHTLLASGYPGVGKTTLARLIAKTMGVQIIELVPPFNIYTLVDAASMLGDGDILFIDEIHKLADSGKRGAEILLKVLEERVAFLPDGDVVQLNDITVIGATTDRDKLPEPVLDRFKIKPYFQAYTWPELSMIAVSFAFRHDSDDVVDDEMAAWMGAACRGTPRILEEMVLAQRDLSIALGRTATPQELLDFIEVEDDGLSRVHIHYLTALYQYFARETKDGEVEYIIGEAAIQQILRETKQGIQRIEAFLVERGLIDRTPRGRRLTEMGIARAEEFIAAGKGAANVA